MLFANLSYVNVSVLLKAPCTTGHVHLRVTYIKQPSVVTQASACFHVTNVVQVHERLGFAQCMGQCLNHNAPSKRTVVIRAAAGSSSGANTSVCTIPGGRSISETLSVVCSSA